MVLTRLGVDWLSLVSFGYCLGWCVLIWPGLGLAGPGLLQVLGLGSGSRSDPSFLVVAGGQF